MTPAPIAVFAYNRPEHLERALTSLAGCHMADASRLFIFCDGPKSATDEDMVAAARRVAARRKWCAEVTIVPREANLGLAGSVIAGTTMLCREFGRAIVVEDDLVLSPWFLAYMNEALKRYAASEQVMQVSGYMFPLCPPPGKESFFLPLTTSWGWAVWERAWRHFDPDMAGAAALERDLELRRQFNVRDGYDYWRQIGLQREGRIDSWAIRWYLTVFLRQGLVLYPGAALVGNQGFDGSGRHCSDNENPFATAPRQEPVRRFPGEMVPDMAIYDRVAGFLKDNC